MARSWCYLSFLRFVEYGAERLRVTGGERRARTTSEVGVRVDGTFGRGPGGTDGKPSLEGQEPAAFGETVPVKDRACKTPKSPPGAERVESLEGWAGGLRLIAIEDGTSELRRLTGNATLFAA